MRLVAPEVIAGAPESRLHLVGDEEDPVLRQDLLHRAEEPVGRRREPADALDRLGDHAGDVAARAHVDDVAEVLHARGRVRVVVERAERAAQPVAALHERHLQAATGSSATTIGWR